MNSSLWRRINCRTMNITLMLQTQAMLILILIRPFLIEKMDMMDLMEKIRLMNDLTIDHQPVLEVGNLGQGNLQSGLSAAGVLVEYLEHQVLPS